METVFVDTNVWLRFLTEDSAAAERARALIERSEAGELKMDVNHIVIAEIVWTLGRSYGVDRRDIADWTRLLLNLDSLSIPQEDMIREALDIFEERNIDFADAYHAAYMRMRGLDRMVSFDRDFDRLEGVQRIEP